MNLIRGPAESPKCGECPFSRQGRPFQPVRGEGPEKPVFVVVGEGPGENERRSGRPFVGQSGKLFMQVLERLGVERSKVWIGNAMLCTPPGATDGQKERARQCCEPRLKKELAELPGRPIAALGAVASRSLIDKDFSITQLAGSLHETEGHHVIPTIHPAAILRGGAEGAAHRPDLLFWNFVYDLGKVARLGEGKLEPFIEDLEIEIEDAEHAHELVRDLVLDARRLRFVSCDTETDSLLAYKANMDTIGLATSEGAVSVRWQILKPKTRNLLAAVLGDPAIEKVFQNHPYDIPVLSRHRLRVRGPLMDTLVAHQNAFPGLPHDLQRIATQFFPIKPWKAEYRSSSDTLEDRSRYNALDALVTARLRAPLLAMVKKTGSERTYAADMEAAQHHIRMHVVGIPLDRKVNAELQERYSAEVAKSRVAIEEKAAAPEILEKLFDRLAMEQAKRPRGASGKEYTKSGKPSKSYRPPDPPGFLDRHAIRLRELLESYASECEECVGWGSITEHHREAYRSRRAEENVPLLGKCPECLGNGRGWVFRIGAPEHIAAYLKARGAPMHKETEKGKISTDHEVLDSLAHLPEVRALIEYREAEKMLSTFILKYARSCDRNNRMHPSWGFAITGRWTARDPQCMNIPRGDTRRGRPNMRAQISAPLGRKIVGFDASQLEARLHALESGDEWLCEIFSHPPVKYGPGDIHSQVARIIWKDYDASPRKSELRDFIKRTLYGAMYQAAVETLFRNLLKDDPNIRIEDVATVVNLIQVQLKGVIRWHQDLLRQVSTPPHEIRECVLGRRLVFPLGYGSPSDIFNFPIQAAGASYMALGLRALMTKLPKGAEMILQVHDACYFECDEAQAEELGKLIEESFTRTLENRGVRVNFPVEVKIGQSLADC